ncbi:glycine cleavage system protein GcvH [Candidatus Margulisiibacteriota bacterium]
MEMYFTKNHEWIKVDGDKVVMGLTTYAVEQLGDITFIELPEIDAETKQNNVLCSIESVKAASDIYAPISGVVTDVNSELENMPEVINKSPEENGWICKLKMVNTDEVGSILTKDQYNDLLKEIKE